MLQIKKKWCLPIAYLFEMGYDGFVLKNETQNFYG